MNSNPYHYKLKFPSTSKQKYNSKLQEFETVQLFILNYLFKLFILKNNFWSKFGHVFCILRVRTVSNF